jgi:hypothetical protein
MHLFGLGEVLFINDKKYYLFHLDLYLFSLFSGK